jgi:triacylglycerol lipase
LETQQVLEAQLARAIFGFVRSLKIDELRTARLGPYNRNIMERPPLYPVVMCHGLFGTERYGAGPIHAGDYYRGILKTIRASGVEVYAPRVHPLAGVYRRTWMLAQRITKKYGDSPIHLIGHSMGGMDARLLAIDPAWDRRILSITTIGTPHLGTPLADVAARRLKWLYSGLEKFGVTLDGLLQITRRHASQLTADWSEPTRAACWSIAGEPDTGDMFFGLRPTHSLIRNWEGPSDGLVPKESAEGWGEPLPAWKHDHFRQINWMTPPWVHPNVILSYMDLMGRLAAIEAERKTKVMIRTQFALA